VNALVTGASGFLGRYVVAELLRRGSRVTAVVRPSTPLPSALAHESVELVRTDLRQPSTALADHLAKSDAVFHLAAALDGSWRQMFDATVLATENVLDVLRQIGWTGRFVHVSTFSVYGLNQVPPGSLVDESTPLESEPFRRDAYAWTKHIQERLVRDLRSAGGAEVVIVRPGVIYGRERQFQHPLGRRLGSTLILLGGRNIVPLNYVENTASLLAECGSHPDAAGEVFNAVDPEPLAQWQYLRHWLRAQPERVTVIPVPLALLSGIRESLRLAERMTAGRIAPPRFLDPYATTPNLRNFRYRSSRATEVLGWIPPIPLAEALRRTFG
jgi:nucleoside-diphosphate-sugar epimerase